MNLLLRRSLVSCFTIALGFQLSTAPVSSALAQELQVFSFEGAAEGDAPSGQKPQVAIAGGTGGVAFSTGPMILGGNPMFGVDPNNRSALFNLLTNESVRRELQLKDDQFAGVQKVMQESQKRISETVRANMAAGKGNFGAGISELVVESRKASEAAIEEILLPEQLSRVRQLAYQVEIAQLGLGEALTSGRLGKEIDVHEDQKQHLTDKAAAIETEARLAIAKIRAAARAKLFAELAPDQRKKAEELLGPHFDYEEPNLAKSIRQRVMSTTAPAKK